MGVLLIDLDDTLILDRAARDRAMSTTLDGFATRLPLSEVWPGVRDDWQASGLRSASAMAGVSSWEALWTDFDAAVTDPDARRAGHGFQARVWDRLLPGVDAARAEASFRLAREALVQAFDWVPGALTDWAKHYDLWCVTNGSSWLQRRKLLLAGLESVFRDVVVSGEIGAEKSDRRFQDEVVLRLVRAGSVPVAVVGDSATSDGVLASALGATSKSSSIPIHPATSTRSSKW